MISPNMPDGVNASTAKAMTGRFTVVAIKPDGKRIVVGQCPSRQTATLRVDANQ